LVSTQPRSGEAKRRPNACADEHTKRDWSYESSSSVFHQQCRGREGGPTLQRLNTDDEAILKDHTSEFETAVRV
jgi:hypothetical protein